MTNNTPKISVVMSCYNRKDYVSDAIESILNQTYKDFEFIIIDDCSTDGTREIIQKYADKDSRIVFIKNAHNLGLISNLNTGLELAKGEYIARMDDDDISLPERFEKQVKYLDEHQDITVLGTFIETFGKEDSMSWVNECDSSIINIIINFFNPMCHPTVMIRNKFLKEHHLQYAAEALHAEEYDLWKNISLKDGKLANLPEILLKYRVHENSITLSKKTRKIQRDTANKIKTELLKRYFNPKETNNIITTINKYPFEANNKIFLYNTLNKMKNSYSELNLDTEPIVQTIEKYCGVPSQMEIFFASDDKFTQHLSVAMASILINSLPIETFNFYILDGGISEKNKKKILQLKSIKDFNIEFIKIDDNIFKDCKITNECNHITKQTYYRFIIPQLKPQLQKAFYFDCDVIVNNSLNKFWNINLKDYYVAAIEDFWQEAATYYKSIGISKSFNAGVLLINNKKWLQDNITQKLFLNVKNLNNKLRWVDQDILNYTFNNNVLFVSPIYNLQQTAFFDTYYSLYSETEMENAKMNPVIIHYSGVLKPWHNKCLHPLWKKYLIYLKYTPFKTEYYYIFIRKYFKGLHSNILGIQKTEKHKIISFLGFKLKIKRKKKRGGGVCNFQMK